MTPREREDLAAEVALLRADVQDAEARGDRAAAILAQAMADAWDEVLRSIAD